MIKRILWFFTVGVIVFIFLRTFPFDNPSLFYQWLVETGESVRNTYRSFVNWVFSIGGSASIENGETIE